MKISQYLYSIFNFRRKILKKKYGRGTALADFLNFLFLARFPPYPTPSGHSDLLQQTAPPIDPNEQTSYALHAAGACFVRPQDFPTLVAVRLNARRDTGQSCGEPLNRYILTVIYHATHRLSDRQEYPQRHSSTACVHRHTLTQWKRANLPPTDLKTSKINIDCRNLTRSILADPNTKSAEHPFTAVFRANDVLWLSALLLLYLYFFWGWCRGQTAWLIVLFNIQTAKEWNIYAADAINEIQFIPRFRGIKVLPKPIYFTRTS